MLSDVRNTVADTSGMVVGRSVSRRGGDVGPAACLRIASGTGTSLTSTGVGDKFLPGSAGCRLRWTKLLVHFEGVQNRTTPTRFN